jgi:hypothetical protein
MRYMLDVVSHVLLGHAKPSDAAVIVNEGSAITSARSIRATKSPCYPMHLSALIFLAAERAGAGPSVLGVNAWCHEAAGMDIPLIDWMCGTKPATIWLENFRENEWTYRHQRCGAWEKADLNPDQESPALDWLVLAHQAGG